MRILRGNPGKRPIPTDEPTPEAAPESFDAVPGELAGDPVAAAEWARVVPLLRVCGLITTADRSPLVALCQTWSRYLASVESARVQGYCLQGPTGIPRVNPAVKVGDAALSQCRALWNELGLTASGRTRVVKLPIAGPEAVPGKWADLA